MATKSNPEPTYDYKSALLSPSPLAGLGLTERQLRNEVSRGRVEVIRFGNRVVLTHSALQDYLDRSTVKAVR